MDGKLFVVIVFLAIPSALIGLTIWKFSSNPVSIFVLISLMIMGAIYLLTYKETFG
jgi:hypothetical protein